MDVLQHLKDIDSVNESSEYLDYREQNLKAGLLIGSIIGILFFMSFYFLDIVFAFKNIEEIFYIRLIASGAILLNCIVSVFTNNPGRIRIHVYITLFIAAIFNPVHAYFTGGFESPYWVGVNIILIVTYVFLPFCYKTSIIIGSSLILAFNAILIALQLGNVNWQKVIEVNFYLIGTYLIGAAFAFFNNIYAVFFYRNKMNIEKAQEEQRESEQQIRNIVENIYEGVYIIDGRKLLFINRSMSDIFGYTSEELGETDFLKLLSPECRDDFLQKNKHRIEMHSERWENELKGIHKDGRIIELVTSMKTIRYRGSSVVLGTVKDVTTQKKMERELAQSEQRLKLALESSSQTMWDWDVHTDKFYFDDNWYHILGYEPGEKPADEMTGAKSTNDDMLINNAMAEHLDGKADHFEVDYQVKTKLGETKWIHSKGRIVEWNDEGKPIRVVGTAQDETEKKAAVEALKRSEERYRLFTENMQDVVWTLNLASDYLTYISPSVIKLRGYTPEEALKQKLSATMSPVSAQKAQSMIQEFLKDFYEGKRGKDFYISDLEQTCKDGGTVWVEVVATFMTDDSGKAFEILGVSRNITTRKLAEEALKKSKERLSFHIQQTPLAYIEWNENLEVLEWNPAAEKMFHYTKDQAKNLSIFKLMTVDDTDKRKRDTKSIWNSILDANKESFKEVESHNKEGEIIYGEWYNTPLKDSDGNIVGLASLIEDITERKKAEIELKDSEEKFRKLTTSAQDAILMIDNNGNITFWNDSSERILGYTKDEAMKKNIHYMIAPSRFHPAYESVLKRLRCRERVRLSEGFRNSSRFAKTGRRYRSNYRLLRYRSMENGTLWE